jgi:hypothetical protein
VSATEPQPGQPCHQARLAGCTCDWLRGYGVGEVREEWSERILSADPACPVAEHGSVADQEEGDGRTAESGVQHGLE